ncbi:MAG: exonuclease subunit SbcD, partial [Bacteroidota bacterium]
QVADSENVHAVLVAGDLFDAFNPPVESVELMYRTLKRLARNGERAVVAIAGNHDSPERIEAPDPLARECGIIFAGSPHSKVSPFSLTDGIALVRSEEGFVELKLPGSDAPLRLLLTPYANEARLKAYLGTENREAELRTMLHTFWSNLVSKYCDERGVNILSAHLFLMQKGGQMLEESDDEKPIVGLGGAQVVYSENIPKGIQYVALGHLHQHHEVASQPCPVVYSGSPLAYSMNEEDQDKYVVIIEAEPARPVSVRPVRLKQGKRLVRKQFTSVGPAVGWLQNNPSVLVELTMATETYLTAAERKRLYDSHSGIVDIIPLVKSVDGEFAAMSTPVDLRKSVEELFMEYFHHEQGQAPNTDLLELFREIQAVEEE